MAGPRWREDPRALIGFITSLQAKGAKGSTQARKSAAVRSFYAFALREGIATRDIASLVDAPKPGSYLPDVLAPDEVEAILDAPPDADPIGIRDRAILELLYACGLRVSELVGLDDDRVDLPNGQVRVIGKGNRERRVPMGDEARERLHRYRSGPRSDWTAGGRRPRCSSGVADTGSAGRRCGAWCGAGPTRRGCGTGSRRTRSGTALRPICWREGPTFAWSRPCSAMLASAPPSSTPI